MQHAQIGEDVQRRAQDLKRRFFVAVGFAVPVMALSMVPAWQFTGWQWVVAALAAPVVTWCAWPFHVAAFRAARHGSSTMDTLVSMGVIVASLWSVWALLFGGAGTLGMQMDMSLMPKDASTSHAEIYFEAATMVTTFLLAGRWAEARTRYRAGDALRSLLELGAKKAHRVVPAGGVELVDVDALQVGDLVVVKPGEKIPTDGRVVRGHAALDTSLLTGESAPVQVGVDDEVTGATINTDGQLTVEVTRVGSDTTLARIGQMVTDAQAGKAPVQRLADRVSAVFVPAVLVISLLTLVGWLIWGPGVQPAFTAAVAVLVIACPCALGLATPTALLVGSGRAAQLGIVIKGPEILESTRQIDTAVLDKTGTITKAQMHVDRFVPAEPRFAGKHAHSRKHQSEENRGSAPAHSADGPLLAAAVEAGSSHPIAQAIADYGNQPGDRSDVDASEFINHAGHGVSATVADQRVFVGSPKWMASIGFDTSALAEQITAGEESGATVSLVATAPLTVVTSTTDTAANTAAASTSAAGASTQESAGENPAVGSAAPMEPGADGSAAPTGSHADEAAAPQALYSVDLAVGGMTCASCVRRVERKLKKLPGVDAQVNLATEQAQVKLFDDVSDQDLVDTVEKAGYTATVLGRRDLASAASTASPEVPTALKAPASAGSPASADSPVSVGAPVSSGSSISREAPGGPTQFGANPRVSDGVVLGAFWVRDEVKESSADAVQQLRGLGVEPVLLTGDNERAAQHVANQVGISQVHAGVLPDDKRDVVADLQRDGHVVAMVGDGVNDAAALAQAGTRGLGMAMGSGTEVAIEAADITLMGSDPQAVATAIRISRSTLRVIKQNLFWAFAYNVAAIPLAIAGLLNPMIAGAAMACSSVIVVLNSLRLKTAK
ncbi:heavy metal translocating P-type ATPase [Gleimia hominis]|uniref:Heavy metal translocating P-type ATPase n=1 Tax=Gleimia hominis TaxID=595468 RepID=A0ABU3I8H0_9ACTO|nr:heavy metal translocating P-type ATPase [Gleimia hominis]MDT3766678.1 heavy metal translocating P-type ATPase [Gleimia hominis]